MTHWSCSYLTLWSRDNQQMTLWSCSHLALFSHVSQLILLTWQSPEFLLKWQLWSWFFGSVMQLVHFDHVTVRKLFSQQSAEPLVTWSELDNINIKQFHEIGIESVLQNWHTKKIDRLPTLHHPHTPLPRYLHQQILTTHSLFPRRMWKVTFSLFIMEINVFSLICQIIFSVRWVRSAALMPGGPRTIVYNILQVIFPWKNLFKALWIIDIS